jgi:protein phosphatase
MLMMVADGVGGHAGGKQASAIAVNTLARFVLNTMPWFFSLDEEHDDDLLEDFKQALAKCDEKVQARARKDADLRRMATTLTMAYVVWPRLYVVHAGDSRCYLLRGSELEQVTTDHTVAQQMVESGILPADRAETSRFSHVLWNAVGGSSELSPDLYKARLEDSDVVLLCTDGLPKYVGDDTIKQVLARRASAEESCSKLIEAATREGGSDDITVVVTKRGQSKASVGTS